MSIYEEIKKEYEIDLAAIIGNLKKQVRFKGKSEDQIKQYAMWMMAKKALKC